MQMYLENTIIPIMFKVRLYFEIQRKLNNNDGGFQRQPALFGKT